MQLLCTTTHLSQSSIFELKKKKIYFFTKEENLGSRFRLTRLDNPAKIQRSFVFNRSTDPLTIKFAKFRFSSNSNNRNNRENSWHSCIVRVIGEGREGFSRGARPISGLGKEGREGYRSAAPRKFYLPSSRIRGMAIKTV